MFQHLECRANLIATLHVVAPARDDEHKVRVGVHRSDTLGTRKQPKSYQLNGTGNIKRLEMKCKLLRCKTFKYTTYNIFKIV
jgi:hypothetical protein